MDPEDESTAYLKYLNDPTASNNYLLSNGVELSDSFPFAEIESADWPSESFPVLLSSPLITEECNNDAPVSEDIQLFNENGTIIESENVEKDIELVQSPDTDELSENSYLPVKEKTNGVADKSSEKTYINYDPIVKENPDGNKEIYLTEKDINNDASIIQLFNTDGSIITIDKSILSSLNLPRKGNEQDKKPVEKNYFECYTIVTANKCKACSFLCESEEEIKNHLDANHPELFRQQHKRVQKRGSASILKNNQKDDREYTIFLCSICNLACSEKEELREHMLSNHELKVTNSNKSSTDKTKEGETNGESKSLTTLSMNLIKQQERARKRVKCSIKGCTLRFARDDLRQRHEACHVGENTKQFKCSECDEKFSIWRICTNHLWKVHKIDLGLLTCPMCNAFKSNSSVRVLTHMAIHNEEKPFLCSECGKGFKTMAQLKNHEVTHKRPEDLPNWSVMRHCTICERYFANSKCLKKHIQSVHENFRPFICNICGHKTARKAMLELHIRQHTGDKPHECPYCDYRTGDHNCLRKHIMRHLGQWQQVSWICSVCFNNHEKAKKYQCPHCPYTSIQSAAYKSHINNRHPGQSGTYSCSYCSYTCINLADYSAHLKRHEAALKESSKGPNINVEATDNQTTHIYLFSNGVEDDETQNCFLNVDHEVEETIDTGGITIPAGLERQLVS